MAAHAAGFAELLRAGEQLGWAGDAQVSARCFWRRRAFKREGGRPSARGRASVEGQVEPRVKEGRILSLLDLGLPPPGRGTWAPGGWLRILGAEQCSPCPSPQSDPVGTGTPAPRVPACRWGAALSPEDPNSRAGSRSHSRWWEAAWPSRWGEAVSGGRTGRGSRGGASCGLTRQLGRDGNTRRGVGGKPPPRRGTASRGRVGRVPGRPGRASVLWKQRLSSIEHTCSEVCGLRALGAA